MATYRIKGDDEIGFLYTVLTTPDKQIRDLARNILSMATSAAPDPLPVDRLPPLF